MIVEKLRVVFISILAILCSAAIAIFVHAIVPAPVDMSLLDGALVKLFGFPVIAVSYFLILYIQCTVAVRYICKRTKVSNLQVGFLSGFLSR